MTEESEKIEEKMKEFKGKLYEAISAKDEQQVKNILSQYGHGYILKGEKFDNHFILTHAVHKGTQSIIQLLLDYGADLSVQYFPPLNNCLSFAVSLGEQDIVEFLLAKGMDVNNSICEDGSTALQMACCKGFLNIITLLIDKGANVSGKNLRGLTALHAAAGQGHREVVELLLKNGAKLKAKDDEGKTPLMYAVGGGLETINCLLKLKFCDCICCEDPDEILKCIPLDRVSAHEETIELLLSEGAKLSTMDKRKERALQHAIRSGDKCIVELLLFQHGAKVKNEILNGMSLLAYAAERKDLELVKILLKRGANPEYSLADNYTPLHAAARVGCDEIVKLLLCKGANVNSLGSFKSADASFSGFTPLNCSVLNNHKSTAHLLLSQGADITAVESGGGSVLHWAARKGDLEMMRLLLKWGIDVNFKTPLSTSLHCAALHKRKDVAEFLIDRGADLGLCPIVVFTAHALSNFSEVTRFLIKETVKYKSLKTDVSNDFNLYYKFITTTEGFREIESECKKEIEQLRNQTFPNTTTSYFSVFEKQPGELALLAADENVIQAIDSEDFLPKKFPMYASSIVKCVLKGVVRKEMQDRLAGWFSNLYKDADLNEPLPELPEKCVHKIFDSLSNNDLKNLIGEYRCSKNILTVDEY